MANFSERKFEPADDRGDAAEFCRWCDARGSGRWSSARCGTERWANRSSSLLARLIHPHLAAAPLLRAGRDVRKHVRHPAECERHPCSTCRLRGVLSVDRAVEVETVIVACGVCRDAKIDVTVPRRDRASNSSVELRRRARMPAKRWAGEWMPHEKSCDRASQIQVASRQY